MYIYDVFLDNSNQGSNTSQWLHHIVSLDIPCRRCSRACKGTRRRSRSCSRSPWQKKMTLEKNVYGEKNLESSVFDKKKLCSWAKEDRPLQVRNSRRNHRSECKLGFFLFHPSLRKEWWTEAGEKGFSFFCKCVKIIEWNQILVWEGVSVVYCPKLRKSCCFISLPSQN